MKTVILIASVLALVTSGYAQDEEMLTDDSIASKISVGANVGLTEPWNTGGITLGTGFNVNIIGQYDLSDRIPKLKVELAFGLAFFSSKIEGSEATETVIPIYFSGIYEVYNLTPEITVSAYGGVGFNLHSFDTGIAETEDESQAVLGVKLGINVAYPINPQMELHFRAGYLKSFTSDIITTFGTISTSREYSHAETPILIGVTYKL